MSSFLHSVVVSQKKPDSSGVNTDLATDDAKKLFEVNIFFTIMIDGLYGQQRSIKKKGRLVLSRKHGPALASWVAERLCVGLKMRATNDFTGVILEKVSAHVMYAPSCA